MRPEITNIEAELRTEIEELKRQLEQKHAGASTAGHVSRPSGHTIRNLVLLFVVILIVGFVAVALVSAMYGIYKQVNVG